MRTGPTTAHDGTFWIAEEYSPSLLHIDTNGQVLKRYAPAGLPADTATTLYPSEGVLPAIFGKRKINRGFEGLTLSPDQRTVYVALQSPLSNPNGAEATSRRIRAFSRSTPAQRLLSASTCMAFSRRRNFPLPRTGLRI